MLEAVIRPASSEGMMSEKPQPDPKEKTDFDAKRMTYGGFDVLVDVG